MFSDHFDVLMLKIIFLKKNIIILMYFGMKNILKSNRNHIILLFIIIYIFINLFYLTHI
jgi:hypothetical protein